MSILLGRTKGSSSFSSVNPIPIKKQQRKRSYSAPVQKRKSPQNNHFPYCTLFNQKRSKQFQEELLSDYYFSSQRTTATSRNSFKSSHFTSRRTSSNKLNHSPFSTTSSGPTSFTASPDSPQLSLFENVESEMSLHNIKEETESETNSVVSSFKLEHKDFSVSLNPRIQNKFKVFGSSCFNKPVDENISQQCKNSPHKMICEKLNHNQRENKRGDDYILQQKSDIELAFVEATQKSYQKLKAQILLASEKFLQRTPFCQKSLIFEETTALKDQSCKNANSQIHNSYKCSAIQPNTFTQANQLISPFDNMIFHIYSSPSTSLKKSQRSLNSSSLLTQQILYKKVYGFLDRFKKKIVSLYPDRLCYQESKSSPLSTISFSHFDVSIQKESFSNVFTLQIDNFKKKYSFRCSDEEQKQSWIAGIADVIILNSNRVKFNLNPKYASVYSKKQVCFLNEANTSLKTGDLIIYQTENHGVKRITNLAVVMKTQSLLQICYYSQERGIETLSLDDFLMFHDVSNLSFRSLRIKNLSLIQQDKLIEDCIQFISNNKQQKKFKDSNIFIHDLYCKVGILQPNTSPNIFKFKETIRTAHLNLHTTKECSFSEEVYVLLPQHVQGAENNDHKNIVQFYHCIVEYKNHAINNSISQQNLIQYSDTLESEIKSQECLLRHQSLISVSSQNSPQLFEHQQQESMSVSPELHSSLGDCWEHHHTQQLKKRSLFN